MGWLTNLFGEKGPANVELLPDSIWMTKQAKYAGIAKQLEDLSTSGTVAILLVAHFPDELERLSEIADGVTGVPVMATLAKKLSTGIATNLNLNESNRVDVLVGERHPIPAVDQQVEQFAGSFPCRVRVARHVSLEDSLINQFAGDSVAEVLKRIGMEENSAIQSSMVSRRITAAQKRIQGQVQAGYDAESAEEWFRKNMPDGRKN